MAKLNASRLRDISCGVDQEGKTANEILASIACKNAKHPPPARQHPSLAGIGPTEVCCSPRHAHHHRAPGAGAGGVDRSDAEPMLRAARQSADDEPGFRGMAG